MADFQAFTGAAVKAMQFVAKAEQVLWCVWKLFFFGCKVATLQAS